MKDRLRAGQTDFVDCDDVRLLVWLDGPEAAIAGPAVENLPWCVGAIRSLVSQWIPMREQNVPPLTEVTTDCLDCTAKDVAVVIMNAHDVIVECGEIFPNSGLASHHICIAGTRRHETQWVTQALRSLADAIAEQDTA